MLLRQIANATRSGNSRVLRTFSTFVKPQSKEVYQTAWLDVFANNHVPTNSTQKAFVLGTSALFSLLNTHRGDLVGNVGETLLPGHALSSAHNRMLSTEDGQEILHYKPRVLHMAAYHALSQTHAAEDITDAMIAQHPLTEAQELAWVMSLLQYPENSLGYHYGRYLVDHEYLPSHRYVVRFIDNPELAYVMQRYREIHDFLHVLVDLPPNVYGELILKGLEYAQVGLPMSLSSLAFAAPLKLKPSEVASLLNHGIPWIKSTSERIANATHGGNVLSIWYEQMMHEDVDVIREKYGFKPFTQH